MSSSRTARRVAVAAGIVLAVAVPGFFSDFVRSLSAYAAIIAILVLSLTVLTGFVGQISFCQYSFAALGAFTVGSLAGGHGWNYWAALPVGVAFAAVVGVLVGIPALRLSGLFLAILTVGVALFFDRFLLVPGTWDAFSGGTQPWQIGRPRAFGSDLSAQYPFYLFVLAVFALMVLLVWNWRVGKTGRVLRAIRDAEIAAATTGLDLTAWKLAAFGISAGLAGLAGGLLAAAIGSVSAASYDFLHSVSLAAVVAVMGVNSIASAAVGGIFLIFGPEGLRHTPLNTQWFQLIIGALLVAQLVFTPEGVVTKTQQDIVRLLRGATHRRETVSPAEVT